MTTKRRATPDDYEEMAKSYEADPPALDEVTSMEVSPAVLRNGRPTGNGPAKGKTPTMAIRLPEPIRLEVEHRVKAGASSSASELIRLAVVEYLENHPAGG